MHYLRKIKGYIREAIEGFLSQTYESLEIIISDDCSDDLTFDLIKECVDSYCGYYRVTAIRNKYNLGIGRHVSKVVEESGGDYIVFAAGDDISKPYRVEHSLSALFSVPRKDRALRTYSFLSRLTLINDKGRVFGHSSSLSDRKGIKLNKELKIFDLQSLLTGVLHTSGPSRVIPKKLHTIFGEINKDCFTEDIVYLFRSFLAGEVVFSDSETVFYRKHNSNTSNHYSLYSRAFNSVADQLRSYLNVAVDRGLLSSSEAKNASRWIEDNVAFRRFYRSKVNGKHPRFSDFIIIIKSPNLSVRRKFGILREYIGIR